MIKSLKVLGSALAAALVLTACSSESGSATTTASTAAPATSSAASTASSASSAASTSSATSASSTSTLSTSGGSSDGGTAAPVQLDDASKAWFTNFCTTFNNNLPAVLAVGSAAAGTAGSVSGEQQLATQASGYNAIAKLASDLSTAAATEPAPGFEGAVDTVGKLVAGFQTVSAAYTKAATDVAAGDPANAAQVIEGVEAEIKSTTSGLDQAIGDFDALFPPGVQAAAAQQVPTCSLLFQASGGADSGSAATTT